LDNDIKYILFNFTGTWWTRIMCWLLETYWIVASWWCWFNFEWRSSSWYTIG